MKVFKEKAQQLTPHINYSGVFSTFGSLKPIIFCLYTDN